VLHDRETCRRAAAAWTSQRVNAKFFGHFVRVRDGRDLAQPCERHKLGSMCYARIPFGVCRTQGSFGKSRWNATLRSSASVAAGRRAGADHQRADRGANAVFLGLRITGFTSLCVRIVRTDCDGSVTVR
jgi:hypothetical protein